MKPFKPVTFSLALTMALAAPISAFAHAHLVSSSPAVGETVTTAATLKITFSEGIELGLSKFEVTGPGGPVTGISAALDAGDTKVVLIRPKTPLVAGEYTVHWHVVSVDTHRTEGTYSFTVK